MEEDIRRPCREGISHLKQTVGLIATALRFPRPIPGQARSEFATTKILPFVTTVTYFTSIRAGIPSFPQKRESGNWTFCGDMSPLSLGATRRAHPRRPRAAALQGAALPARCRLDLPLPAVRFFPAIGLIACGFCVVGRDWLLPTSTSAAGEPEGPRGFVSDARLVLAAGSRWSCHRFGIPVSRADSAP